MRRVLLPLLAVTLVTTAACTRRNTELGAGPDVSVCVAFVEIDGFDEPAPGDRVELLRWGNGVRRVLERVDEDARIGEDRDLASDAVLADVERLSDQIERFVADVDAASTEARLRDAVSRLATSDFSSPFNRTQRELRKACR